ncbi:hypothetical protein HNV12_06525 [Methanococcoides sp. SA1]|nr:hypothetical protein [Methanococcoides sp. SA1]
MKQKSTDSDTKQEPWKAAVALFVAFFLIGIFLGPSTAQVYEGESGDGSDTITLTNTGMLNTRLTEFSIVPPVAIGTGGDVTTDGDYVVHTFTSDGTFTPTAGMDVEVLVVAGGGGGGASQAGGGGAGGLVYSASHSVTAQAYNVIVGAGGTGGPVYPSDGTNGADSIFDTLVAIGGGYGAEYGTNGGNGGSGGGGAYLGLAGSGSQGQDGGDGAISGGNTAGGGGGGGAGQVGLIGTSTVGGNGGAGLQYSISGTPTYYAGGGGGSTWSGGASEGGIGGGGSGGNGGGTPVPGGDGVDGLGGGGGAGGGYSVTYEPKSMRIFSADQFQSGQDLQVLTELLADGTPVQVQPSKMRARLLDQSGTQYLDEIVESTSITVPGKYLKAGSYELRFSYYGAEFGGWSNEIIASFATGTPEFVVTHSLDAAPAGYSNVADLGMSFVDTSLGNWKLTFSSILAWISALLGVD